MIKEQTIRTRDGWELAASVFLPDTRFHTVLIVGPAMGHAQSRYAHFARFCRDRGGCVLTFDYRQTGRSRQGGGAARNVTLHQWAVFDLDAVLLSAKNQFPGCELVFLAHGLSCQLVGLAPASLFLDRLLFINGALHARRLFSWGGRLRMMAWGSACLFWRFLPAIVNPSDIPLSIWREWLKLSRRPGGLFDVFPSNNFRQMELPLLTLSFTDDWMAAETATRALILRFPNASVQTIRLSPAQLDLPRVGHAGFFQLPAMQPLWEWIVQWIHRPEIEQPAVFRVDNPMH